MFNIPVQLILSSNNRVKWSPIAHTLYNVPVICALGFFLWQSILDCRADEPSFSFIILLKIRGRGGGLHEILSFEGKKIFNSRGKRVMTKCPSFKKVNCTEIASTMHKMIQSNEPSVKLMDHLGRSLFLYQGHEGAQDHFYQFQYSWLFSWIEFHLIFVQWQTLTIWLGQHIY